MNYKLALKYGTLSGVLIISSFFLWDIASGDSSDSATGEMIGFGSMLLAFSVIFIGLKNFRDKQLGGLITFKQAFLNGVAMVTVASIIYVAGWMIYMPNFAPDFADKYTSEQVAKIQEDSGLSEEEKTEKINELHVMMENYSKPHVMAAYTFVEIFPIGLVVTLIVSLILKKKKRLA